VAETTANCPNVLAGHEYARGGEVTQVVEADLEPKIVTDPTESERDVIRSPRSSVGDIVREHVGVIRQHRAGGSGRLLASATVEAKRFNCSGVETDTAAGVCLRLLLKQKSVPPNDDGPLDEESPVSEVDVVPCETTQLAATGAGYRCKAQEAGEIRVDGLGCFDQPANILSGRHGCLSMWLPGR